MLPRRGGGGRGGGGGGGGGSGGAGGGGGRGGAPPPAQAPAGLLEQVRTQARPLPPPPLWHGAGNLPTVFFFTRSTGGAGAPMQRRQALLESMNPDGEPLRCLYPGCTFVAQPRCLVRWAPPSACPSSLALADGLYAR
jgi:hypothetical protein